MDSSDVHTLSVRRLRLQRHTLTLVKELAVRKVRTRSSTGRTKKTNNPGLLRNKGGLLENKRGLLKNKAGLLTNRGRFAANAAIAAIDFIE